MNPSVFKIFLLLLLCLDTKTYQLIAVGGGGNNNGVVTKCFVKERQALLHFKVGLQDPYGRLGTWRAEEEDCCKWKGITCHNQTGHVTGLDISSSGLGGEISHSLLNLSHLNYVSLHFNYFYQTIPTFIGSLTQLRYLHLGNNGFNGTNPMSFGSLTKLAYLNLSYNILTGTIPESIGSLAELVTLDISVNNLGGTIPPEFGNLTNLQELNLDSVGRCRVENLEWLSHMSHLEELTMDGISLAKQNHWVDVIMSLQNLSYLSLGGCELSQVMYPYSSFLNSSFASIEALYLRNNNLTSSMYRWLFPLTSNKLRALSLSGNMLDGVSKYLGNLCSLEWLEFYENSVVVKFPDFLNNLSGCASLTLKELVAPGSQFTGSLPDVIQKFSSLSDLDLSKNKLNGTISKNMWELPMLRYLDFSLNYLRGAMSGNIGKSKATFINLSNNTLAGVPSTDHISNLSDVEHFYMSFCKLGPRFPKWIQKFKKLTRLHIAGTKISDTIPLEFWDTWPSQLQYLNLASNNISGKVPDLSSNFDNNSVINLSSNSFYGPIPHVSSSLAILDLSTNKFSGGISFLCQIVGGYLEFLDLSHNFLSGQLPDCLWHFKELKVLNLGHNHLSGKLPPSIESLIKLEVMYLYKNEFSGELPLSLKNFTRLNSLNLGANKFSGNLPVWIGENLRRLYALILKSNNFSGIIPLQLCQLKYYLHILDLSMNNLHGTIPSCLNNLTGMVQEGLSPKENVRFFTIQGSHSVGLPTYILVGYADHAMVEWQGDEREFLSSNLRLLKSIDLSSNNLTGQIPYELTDLHGLFALNLSKNALLGEIPRQIGEMKNLLALDLSENNLSGGIPSSMTRMTFLGYLDVSSNNLSGRIPTSTQLQSFEPSSYNGNTGLCGPPLIKKCLGDEELEVPSVVGDSEGDEEGTNEVERWFYIGGVTGFATGFWIACGALLLNRRGRHAFFRFYDNFKDWVYVKVVLFVAKLQRVYIHSCL